MDSRRTQSGLALLISRISLRIRDPPTVVLTLNANANESRNPCRCHWMTVAGLTNIIVSRQRGHKRYSQTQSKRSIVNSRGRPGRCRRRTCSWWRRARFSSC